MGLVPAVETVWVTPTPVIFGMVPRPTFLVPHAA